MIDGIIELDTARGKEIGFTSDKYDGYLWKEPNRILISFIESKKKGNFRELVRRIHEQGLSVAVPTPLGLMERILRKNDYTHAIEDSDMGPIEVWTKHPRT